MFLLTHSANQKKDYVLQNPTPHCFKLFKAKCQNTIRCWMKYEKKKKKKKCHTEILPKIIFPFKTEWMGFNSSEHLLHKSWDPSTNITSQVSYNAKYIAKACWLPTQLIHKPQVQVKTSTSKEHVLVIGHLPPSSHLLPATAHKQHHVYHVYTTHTHRHTYKK